MRRRKDGSDLSSTVARAWADMRESQARLAALKPSDQELLTDLRKKRDGETKTPAAIGPVVSNPIVSTSAPAHPAQDEPKFLEMLELIRGAGL